MPFQIQVFLLREKVEAETGLGIGREFRVEAGDAEHVAVPVLNLQSHMFSQKERRQEGPVAGCCRTILPPEDACRSEPIALVQDLPSEIACKLVPVPVHVHIVALSAVAKLGR